MLKLQDFARECGVTDRQVQRLLKRYEADIVGHFERKGNNGTWLDEVAQDFLKGKMKQAPIVVGDSAQLREAERLQARIEQLEGYNAQKEALIMKLLEDANLKQERLNQLERERLLLEDKTREQIKATEDRLTLDFRGEIEHLRQELETEKKRPLTLKERLTGRKE